MAYKTFKVDGDLEGKMVTELTNLFNGQYEELGKRKSLYLCTKI